MKLKFIAASVAAIASVNAYAQSSVTLYGVADVGVEYVNHADGNHGVVRMQSGNMSGSRWGMRGVEELGGGLKGIFTLESGFSIDNGTATNRLFSRQAFVGLQSSMGTLTLGRHQTPLYDFSMTYDPMAIASRYSIVGQDADMASRADNSLKYTGIFGGFTLAGLYSFGYDNNGEVPGVSRQGREFSASVNYATGPLSIGAVYDQQNQSTTAATGTFAKNQRASVAATYTFGAAKAFAGWRWAQFSTTDNSLRSHLFWGGLGYQVTPALSLTGAAYYQGFRGTSADPWLFVGSADYALSKRTDLYLNLAYALNKSDSGQGVASALGVGGFAGGAAGSSGYFTGSANKQNQFGAVVGIRHKF